jgi:uncharacterized membrane protein YhiD involved in acid resistance
MLSLILMIERLIIALLYGFVLGLELPSQSRRAGLVLLLLLVVALVGVGFALVDWSAVSQGENVKAELEDEQWEIDLTHIEVYVPQLY